MVDCKKKIIGFLQNIDMFGKEARLYYNGEEKKSSNFGIIISILYLLIYTGLLFYKLLKMIKKIDFSFYDSFAYIEEPPSIHITPDNFYGGFGLEVPDTYDPFIDETIYYPKASFKTGIRHGDKWNWTVKDLPLERCNLSKFGQFYRSKFKENALHNLYCFKEMNETFIGHFSHDYYSMIFIELFPCKNTTENNNKCKPIEVIDSFLKGTFICMEFQDIELTPHNYSYPARARNQDIYFTVGKKLFKEVHILYQITKIETDLEFLGIDELENIKNDTYLKYHSTNQMTNILEEDIYQTGQAFCNITIKLNDQVRIQRRSYTKLINIWGDVGGLMEVIKMILNLISFSSLDILYENSILNNILKNDTVDIKIQSKINKYFNKRKNSKRKDKRNDIVNPNTKVNNDQNGILGIHIIIINNKKKTERKITISDNNQYGNELNRILTLNKIRQSKTLIHKFSFNQLIENIINMIKGENKSKNNSNNNSKENPKNENVKNKGKDIFINNYINPEKANKKDKDISEPKEKRNIKINRPCVYFCCFCVKKRKTEENKWLKQGMEIFKKKMDIFNIFEMMIKNDDKFKNEEDTISSI